jgi:hypothetical protein
MGSISDLANLILAFGAFLACLSVFERILDVYGISVYRNF